MGYWTIRYWFNPNAPYYAHAYSVRSLVELIGQMGTREKLHLAIRYTPGRIERSREPEKPELVGIV